MTTTHNERLDWLQARGFLADANMLNQPEIGSAVWIDGYKGKRPVSLWLAVDDGRAILHGANDPPIHWEALREWIEPGPVAKGAPEVRGFDFGED